jgi:uncharacterized membrane-anchored protein YitT (DUF2179 family)
MQAATHRLYEDALAIISGAVFVALGLAMYQSLGLLTGGTSGIALIISKVADINFGLVFFVINLPFYVLAAKQIGWRFTLNTFVSVSLVSVLTENMHYLVAFESIEPMFAGLVGGMLMGMGMLIMFRHKSSLGGLGILAFYLQQKRGIRAGNFQLLTDCMVLAVSFFIVGPYILAVSVIGAVATNIILAVNHKPGRYHINYSEALSEHASELVEDGDKPSTLESICLATHSKTALEN